MHRAAFVLMLLTVVVALSACMPGPPKSARFNGKQFQRGTIAREGVYQSFLYTIPEQGLSQDERLGVIAAKTKDQSAKELQAWIMSSYRGATSRRVFEEEPTPTTACKVGSHEGRNFIGLHVCGEHEGYSGCIELDEKLAEPTPKDRAPSLCAEYRGKHEAELKGLLPPILSKME